MRRVLAMLLGLGLVTACVYGALLSPDSSDDGQADVVMPYPRTLKPLPVPEVRIGEGPWQDPLPSPVLPSPVPSQVPKFADGLLHCSTATVPGLKAGDESRKFRTCRTG